MNRIEQIRAECVAEAMAREARFTIAQVMGLAADSIGGRHAARFRTARTHLSRVEARDATATVPADRTPCAFCETRSDIGCKHQVRT